MKISPIRWSFSSRSFITRASVSVSRAWIWRREKYTAMTMAMIIATVWTSVRSSGKPISTMRSEQQARLIKIEACGGWDDAMRWADGLSRLSGFRRPNMWTRRALRRPNQSTNHVPGDTSPESDDEHLEPFPPPRPDRDLCLVPADPEERDRAQQDREDRSPEDVIPDEEERTQGDEVPHDGRGPDEERARPRGARLDGRQLELEGHHEFELRGRVAADPLHDLLEIGVPVAPPSENLADLVPFRFRWTPLGPEVKRPRPVCRGPFRFAEGLQSHRSI